MPSPARVGSIVEWAIMEFAETLVFAGMVRRYIIGEPEEKESEGFSEDKVKARFLDATGARFGLEWAARDLRDLFHLFKVVYDGGVELVFIGEVVLKVATGRKHLWAEGTPMATRELAEEAVEVELVECRGNVLTALTAKEGKVARVHSGIVGRG
jgi:hypothetical protein